MASTPNNTYAIDDVELYGMEDITRSASAIFGAQRAEYDPYKTPPDIKEA